ncbi:MAG: hypothetical protein QM610_08200 [Chitinophagaceae bacterium]
MKTKKILLAAILLHYGNVYAQDTTTHTDEAWQQYVNTIDINDAELTQEDSPSPSSLLLAGRNYFLNVYNFSFFAVRYRQRGYENFPGRTYINNIPINSLETNSVPYNMFSGMGNVFRVGETAEQLAASDFSFGGLGNHYAMNTSPTNQRNRLRVNYTFSNRNYQHRLSAVYNSGYDRKGWNYLIALNARYSSEGYYPGSYYNGQGYLISVEKKIKRNVLSLAVWATPYESGRQSPTVKEVYALVSSNYYNPQWGWQNGKKRNANVSKSFLPTATANYKANLNNKTYWQTGIGATIGKVSYSGLEWYNAPDPRPDYYRYLPSYYQNDAYQYEALTNAIKSNPDMLQIDWNKMYQVNLSQTDGRALYALGNRNTEHLQINAASSINTIINDKTKFSGGLEYQYAKLHYYKSIKDLLGAQYWLNVNAFVERDNPSDRLIIQNDLDNPEGKVLVGDKYSYDYSFVMQRFSEWGQLQFNTKKWDMYSGLELNVRQLYRVGNVRNGLFPDNSKDKDVMTTDFLFNSKIGVTYKIDGRKYIFLNAALMQQPPMPNTVYVSPTTRNIRNDSVRPIQAQSVEAGFVMNAPLVKVQINSYYTLIKHAAEFRYFYDDVHQGFASYSLFDIAKKHYGAELSLDWKFYPNWTYSFVSNLSRSLYNNRPQLMVTSETSADILSRSKVFLKNYKIANTPQTIVHNSVGYRNGNYFFTLSANAFFDRWSAINPMRRTTDVLENINPVEQNELLSNMLRQEKLPNGYLVDLFAGHTFFIKKKNDSKNRLYIDVSLSGSNLLNRNDIIGYAFEQMRLDLQDYNLDKFPNKYSYAMGRNYSINISLRF